MFFFWYVWGVFCELDVMLAATVQRANSLFLILLSKHSHPANSFWCGVNQKEVYFDTEYNFSLKMLFN